MFCLFGIELCLIVYTQELFSHEDINLFAHNIFYIWNFLEEKFQVWVGDDGYGFYGKHRAYEL